MSKAKKPVYNKAKNREKKQNERENHEWYRKYRWFFTSSGKLVIGGKSAEQNEEVVNNYVKTDSIVMHTKLPGSPFSVIVSNGTKNLTSADLEETATFTACFSRAWRDQAKKVEVHLFKGEQIYKDEDMKKGTFGVRNNIEIKKVPLSLVLDFQKGVLRAIPKETSENPLIKICPGKIDKEDMALKIHFTLLKKGQDCPLEEIVQALPSGGVRIC